MSQPTPSAFHHWSPLRSLALVRPSYRRAIAEQGEEPLVFEDLDPDRLIMAVPVLAVDKTRLGTVVLEYSKDIFQPRFLDTLRRAAISTALILLILVPLGWLWGKRIASPLLDLSSAIAKVPKTRAADIQFPAPAGNDEIGMLGRRFGEMLAGLKEKARWRRRSSRRSDWQPSGGLLRASRTRSTIRWAAC